MSRGIVCGCGVVSYCEGRGDVNNTVGVLFLEDERTLGVYCGVGYRVGDVVVGAVVVVIIVSRVIIAGTVMLGGCHVGGCCVEIYSGGSCGVGGCRGCVCNEEGYVIKGCRVEGCRGCVTVLRVIVSGDVVLRGAVRGGIM